VHNDSSALVLLAIAILLTSAKACGTLARRLRQPAVVGEIAAGILLGPTLLGRLAPELQQTLFPMLGERAQLLDGLNEIGIVVFLFMAGAEIDVAGVTRRARPALAVAVGGMILPMLVGASLGWLAPGVLGWEGHQPRWLFALFLGTALCISALPVIARTLLDLGVYRSDLGMTVMTAAVLNDVAGWLLFAFILGNLQSGGSPPSLFDGVFVMGVALALWAAGRPLVHILLSFVHRRTRNPASALAVMMPMVFGGAAASSWFGMHAMFGAFLVGATAAGSPHFREQTRGAMQDFVSVLFAPLFFASIGLEADFIADFDAGLVLLLFAVASVGKIVGCGVGARVAGIASREAWAIGFAMNARGAMEIVLALVAREADLIGQTTFVGLVVMAIGTSMLSGPMIARLFPRQGRLRLVDAFAADRFIAALDAREPDQAIRELVRISAQATGLDEALVTAVAIEREQLVSTALGGGVAAPHARLAGLARPVVAVGISPVGVDFDSPDGAPVRIVFLILTPQSEDGAQLEILSDIAGVFSDAEAVERLCNAPHPKTLVDLMRPR
jgi:Kef-type K+ transport system membrane component KefB/mannitol/fructose-specific phosphotransferase system IIA component (Ntr-type)